MPRNASGTYALPAGNPVVTATTILSAWANTTLDDIKTEMTDSLSRSGKGGMLGSLLLVNGTAALPALAFNVESTTGLYRPAANALGLSVAGAQQLQLSTTAPAFLVTSPLAAADASNDTVFNTTAVRTAGNLFVLQTGGSNRLRITNVGSISMGGTGGIITTNDGTNLGLQLIGNKAAADVGQDVIVNSTVTRTAGDLLNVRNNGAARWRIRFDGAMFFDSTVASITAGATNSGLVLSGNLNVADTGTDIICTTQVTRTAGLLFDVRNGGSSVFAIQAAAGIVLLSAASADVRANAANSPLALRGNLNAADTGTDLILASLATRTAGNLLDVRNGASSRFIITQTGALQCPNAASLSATGTNSFLTLKGNLAAADTGVDVVISSSATRTAGALLQVQNNGSYRAQVSPVGAFQLASAGTTDLTIDPGTGLVRVDTANTALTLKGNRSAADAGSDLVLTGQATRTAGNLLDVQNNATSKFKVDFNGDPFARSLPTGEHLVVLTADRSTTSSVASNVTDMVFSTDIGEYEFEMVLFGHRGGSTTNLQVKFTTTGTFGLGPGGCIYNWNSGAVNNVAVSTVLANAYTGATLEANGDANAVRIVARATCSAAGTIQLQFASSDNITQVTIAKDSFIRYRKLA